MDAIKRKERILKMAKQLQVLGVLLEVDAKQTDPMGYTDKILIKMLGEMLKSCLYIIVTAAHKCEIEKNLLVKTLADAILLDESKEDKDG